MMATSLINGLAGKLGLVGPNGHSENEAHAIASTHEDKTGTIETVDLPLTNGFTGHNDHDTTNHTATQSKRLVPVAICGMAMRLPGGITTDAEFWRFLMDKKDARCPVPADRYHVDALRSSNDTKGSTLPSHGYFLDYLDLAHFDASFFSMTRSEVAKLDPQHRMLLELTR